VRPAALLLLRAIAILGAVLAVMSCGFVQSLEPEDAAGTLGGGEVSECARIPLSDYWATVPAAGSTVSASTGAGQCM
jgi:hypothetical protein